MGGRKIHRMQLSANYDVAADEIKFIDRVDGADGNPVNIYNTENASNEQVAAAISDARRDGEHFLLLDVAGNEVTLAEQPRPK